MKSGVINIYKEKGFTSFDVVAKMRGILHMKKIGHTGTLDPDAVGVLPVCIGKATRLCDMLTDKDKEYETVLYLGCTTDTQDMTGTVLTRNEVICSEEQVRSAIRSFIGPYDQIPPMYSALKVNGQKLCNLARKGIEVERQPRRVTVFDIKILSVELPRVTMRVHCSKGTYIRTLCEDIGAKLGCGGCMESLVRTRVERFGIENAITLAKLQDLVREGNEESVLIPVDEMFDRYPKAYVLPDYDKMAENGNSFELSMIRMPEGAGRVRLYMQETRFVGIYEYSQKKNQMVPVRIFLE